MHTRVAIWLAIKYVMMFNFTKGLQCSYTYVNYNFQYELCIQPLYVHHNHLTTCMLNLIYAKTKDHTFINWLHVGFAFGVDLTHDVHVFGTTHSY